jgi:predicted nucleic acid-binding protein
VALLYLDTSVLVKLYVRETGTERMLALAHPDAGHRLAILSLSRVEFRAAVRHRAKLGDLEPLAVDGLLRDFGQHAANLFQVQPLNDAVLDEAAGAVDRHALRAYDAVHLGGCLALRSSLGLAVEIEFVCADAQLLAAARADGLTTVNPCAE